MKELDAEYLEGITLEMACRAEQADHFLAHLQKLNHHGIAVEKMGDGFVTIQT